MTPDITVVIATIPPRTEFLARALGSVLTQTLQPAGIVVEYDHLRTGAAATKNRAVAKVDTDWIAMLDDDDEFGPEHLNKIRTAAEETGADVVYPWPLMNGVPELRPDRFGKPFDGAELRRGNYIPNTVLARTKLVKQVGGFQCPAGTPFDDWGLLLKLLDAGAQFHHVPERTWVYNILGQNTSGMPNQW